MTRDMMSEEYLKTYQHDPLDPIDLFLRQRSEANIAANRVLSHSDRHIVKTRRVWRPRLR